MEQKISSCDFIDDLVVKWVKDLQGSDRVGALMSLATINPITVLTVKGKAELVKILESSAPGISNTLYSIVISIATEYKCAYHAEIVGPISIGSELEEVHDGASSIIPNSLGLDNTRGATIYGGSLSTFIVWRILIFLTRLAASINEE